MASNTVVFAENHTPALQAGEYVVTVEQYLHNKNPKQADGRDRINPETFTDTKRFAVRGPRFTLDAGDCVALFPPANNQGEYDNTLPHVVLARPTLPWMRSPDGTDNGYSWLAVLTFAEGDPTIPVPAVQTIQVGDLFHADFSRDPSKPDTSKSTLPPDAVSYEEGFKASGLTFGLEDGQPSDDRCQAIDLSAAAFNAIAPSLEELRWLAHVRSVSTVDKPGQPSAAPVDYAVVVGNRLPKPNSRCTAHLVSLEGLRVYLPLGDQYTPQLTAPIRLVSLTSWSFKSQDPLQTFEKRLERLDGGVGALRVGYTRGTAQLMDPAAALVSNAFQMGYTAVDHRTREGDTTVSWYRGPLLPYAPPPSPLVPPPDPLPPSPVDVVINTADQLVRYDPGTGMMDVSYATAWQLGRLLALQNRSFAIALYNWKRGLAQKTAQAVEHSLIAQTFGRALAVTTPLLKAQGSASSIYRAAGAFIATALKPVLTSKASISEAASSANVSSVGARPRAARSPLVPRSQTFDTLTQLVSTPAALADVHEDTPVDPEITDWLARLRVFSGVPLAHLVPDERALPVESLRFFYVDPNWIDSLVQGAYSIGRSTSADLNHDAALAPAVQATATAKARLLRSTAAGVVTGPCLTTDVTGLLLRSSVVSGWPGIEVKAYDADNNQLTNVLRHDLLASTLLLFIVEGVIDHVDISEPAEGLHFGVDADSTGKGLRYITVPAGAPPNTQPGNEIDKKTKTIDVVPYRGNGVIAVNQLAGLVKQALIDVNANNDPAIGGPARDFTPAELAVEMVEGVQSVRFFYQAQPSQ